MLLEGANNYFGKVLLTCATNMAKQKFEAGTKTRKKCANYWKGCRKSLPERTLAEVLHAFLPSILYEIHENPHFWGDSQNRHPSDIRETTPTRHLRGAVKFLVFKCTVIGDPVVCWCMD